MTEPLANRNIHLASVFSQAWKKLTITIVDNSQLFLGPPDSIELDRLLCCPCDQSLFVNYVVFIHYLILSSICSLYLMFTPC